MILVGISNSNHRTRDLTTSAPKLRFGMPFEGESGGAEAFTQFIAKELIPYIDQKYPSTSYRTLIGHSFAGLFTINTFLYHTELFANYLAIDPSLDWDDQKLLQEAKAVLSKKNFSGKSVYLTLSGQLHMQNSNITIDNVMEDTSDYTLFPRSILELSKLLKDEQDKGLNSASKFYPNDLHGTVPLPSLIDGLVYLFDWYQIEGTDKFNDPNTPKAELIALIRNREQKLKKHFGYSVPPFEEALFNMLGYMNMDWGQLDKSLAFFELNLEFFPTSANAYDSIADYYLAQKDSAKALEYLRKAYELSGAEYHRQRIEEMEGK